MTVRAMIIKYNLAECIWNVDCANAFMKTLRRLESLKASHDDLLAACNAVHNWATLPAEGRQRQQLPEWQEIEEQIEAAIAKAENGTGDEINQSVHQ